MKVYKYRHIDQNTERLLKYGEIFLNKPENFNDPFDSRSLTVYEGSFDDWRDFFTSKGEDAETAARLAEHWKDRKLDVEDTAAQDLDQRLNRVSCFSEVNDSILMWSHYADSHKGVCFEFSPIVENTTVALPMEPNQVLIDHPLLSNYAPLMPVKYTEQMAAPFNRLKEDSRRLVTDFFLQKHSDWSYEKERRILLLESYLLANPIRIQKSAITGIIFGLKMDPIEKEKYRKICREEYLEKGLSMTMYNAKPDLKKYGIIVENE